MLSIFLVFEGLCPGFLSALQVTPFNSHHCSPPISLKYYMLFKIAHAAENVCAFSVSPFEEATGDDLRLNFSRPFKDVEDAGIAQHPGNRIFQRIAVAAVNL